MLTVSEAAAEANVTMQAIYNAIKRERLTATEKYGVVLIERTDLKNYLATAKKGRPVGTTKKAKAETQDTETGETLH